VSTKHPISPLVKGLYTEGAVQIPPSVVNETLAVNLTQLVPKPGGDVSSDNPLDHWLARKPNGAVRLFMGRGPGNVVPNGDWLALGAVTVHDPTDNITGTVNRWWEADVQAAQHAAVAKIAAKYDGLVTLIFIANGGTIYAEPYVRGINDANTCHNLLAAGYTAAGDQASYEAGFEMFAAFKQTRLGQAFNPWQGIHPDGTGYIDVDFTIKMMDALCARFPRRAVIQNNSIRTPTFKGPMATMYDHMKMLHETTGRTVRFQTATKPRVGDFAQTLEWALDHGACAVELSPGVQNCSTKPCLSAMQLAAYDDRLRAVA
jgi:hypothetical protein